MKLRKLAALLPLLASPIVSGLISSHPALAGSSLHYDIEAGNSVADFTLSGPVGLNSATPVLVIFDCGGYSVGSFSGWTIHGTATTLNWPSPAASEADTAAPGVAAVTMSDSTGDVVRISGVGIFNNNLDTMTAGAFTLSYTPSNGATTTCKIGPGGTFTNESEME
jgi:hypothetical protein